jgi:hypothetical protein
MALLRPPIWIVAFVFGCSLACSFGTDTGVVIETDEFAPDAPVSERTPLGSGGHLPSDLRGIWVAEVRAVDQRRLDVLQAGRDGEKLVALDPPLRAEEQVWFVGASDPLSEHYHWWFCATRCRIEIRDSGIWIEGYLIYDRLGSSLMSARIEGRDVFYDLVGHDPDGRQGVIHLRMNREWTGFRVIHVELDGFSLAHMEDLLVLSYYRRTPELR